MRQANDLGYDRNHQGAGLLNLNRTLRQLQSSRDNIFHFRKRELLRWAIVVAFFFGGAFLLSVKPWQKNANNTPVFTQTAQAQAIPAIYQINKPHSPSVFEAQADIPPIQIGPRYSNLEHEQASTNLRSTISRVGQILDEEIIR